MPNLDRTFCAYLNCQNACGRQITDEIREAAESHYRPLSMAYFCGEPEEKEQPDDQ